MDAWWSSGKEKPEPAPRACAVAYYRHSAADRQENSVPIQQELVGKWCKENQIEIIKEFADRGVSGLSTERRDAFNDMMENWVKKRDDFQYVVALDVSRWGRFQDIDLSAAYSSDCTRHGKQVVYTNLGLPKKNDPIHSILVSLERYRAAQYSRELSEKVTNGLIKISRQGFRPGGYAPYGLTRLLLNEERRPVKTLKPGEWKSIQNQRVTLAPGDPKEVAVVRRIFREFVLGGRLEREIAKDLNRDGIPAPGGGRWEQDKVHRILTMEVYTGTIIWNRTTERLMSLPRPNPREEWVRTPSAFKGIISGELYERAAAIFAERKRRQTPEYVVERVKRVFDLRGMVTRRLVNADAKSRGLFTYRRHFRSIDRAFQEIYSDIRIQVIRTIRTKLEATAVEVEDYEDFIVVNRSLSLVVQPSVPVPWGYDFFWSFRLDRRPVIDVTLGVPLSGPPDYAIMGYLALPRLLLTRNYLRVFPHDWRFELYGHEDLDFIKDLVI